MPQLTLTRVNTTTVECTFLDDDGNLVHNYYFRAKGKPDQQRLARDTGVPLSELLHLLQQVPAVAKGETPPSVSLKVAAPVVESDPELFTLRVRGIHQPAYAADVRTYSDPLTAIRTVLADATLTADEPVVEWEGVGQLACLDVDYHYADELKIPQPHWRIHHAAITRPQPVAYHLSHGGGVKLYYTAREGFRADELAAVAGVRWLTLDARCRVEVKSQTRHPGYTRRDTGKIAGEVYTLPGTVDVTELARWLGREVSQDQVQEWLRENGYKVGDRLDHSHCPIFKGYASHDTPVWFGDAGILCHSCQASGRSLGGRKAGFVSYGKLIGGVQPVIAQMVRRFCHWQHAEIVIADRLKLTGQLARLAYASLLKLTHGVDDPRIPAVFHAGRDMVRQRQRWTSIDGEYTYPATISPMLQALPATQRITEKGESKTAKPDGELVCRFATGANLAEYGYPEVQPLMGCKVYGHFLDYTDGRVVYPIPNRRFKHADGRFIPQYLSRGRRQESEEAWKVVEQYFPGISRDYIKLLIVQKGFVEGSATQAPFVVVSGPTGAGKSTTVHVAASICGDHCTDVTWVPDTTRLRQQIFAGGNAGTFLAVNEVFKESQAAKVTSVQALDPILNLTEDSTSHILHIGPLPLDKLPALTVTDIEVPADVRNDKQLGRRFIYVPLRRQVDWEEGVVKSGMGKPALFRCLNDDTCLAANTILSEVIDEFFTSPILWVDAARRLGFKLLCDSQDAMMGDGRLRLLFKLVCEAPPLDGSEAVRYPGVGWKKVRQEDMSPLAELWHELADGVGKEFGRSRACKEVDWQKVLGTENDVEIGVAAPKAGVAYLRFYVGDSHRPGKVNEDCVEGGLEKFLKNLR